VGTHVIEPTAIKVPLWDLDGAAATIMVVSTYEPNRPCPHEFYGHTVHE